MSMCMLWGDGLGWVQVPEEARKRVLDILKLELQGYYELHDVGDGTKFGSFARWMHSLNYWLIHFSNSYKFVCFLNL